MKRILLIAALLFSAVSTAAPQAAAALNIITTTSDLASIVARGRRRQGHGRIAGRGYQDPHFVEAKPSFVFKLNKADLLVLVGRDLEIGWLPPLITQSRNPKIQAGSRRLPRRVAHRQDPRPADRADHPRDGRRAPARQSALLAGSGEWPPHRQGGSSQAVADGPGQCGLLRAARRRLRPPAGRGAAALEDEDGAVQGRQGRHLSPLLAELRRRVRPRRDRLRRAEAGHPADAAAHPRRDPGDEGAAGQADHGGAVLRLEDAELDRLAVRREGAGAAAVGRRCAGRLRLLQAVRRRHHAAGRRDQATGAK